MVTIKYILHATSSARLRLNSSIIITTTVSESSCYGRSSASDMYSTTAKGKFLFGRL